MVKRIVLFVCCSVLICLTGCSFQSHVHSSSIRYIGITDIYEVKISYGDFFNGSKLVDVKSDGTCSFFTDAAPEIPETATVAWGDYKKYNYLKVPMFKHLPPRELWGNDSTILFAIGDDEDVKVAFTQTYNRPGTRKIHWAQFRNNSNRELWSVLVKYEPYYCIGGYMEPGSTSVANYLPDPAPETAQISWIDEKGKAYQSTFPLAKLLGKRPEGVKTAVFTIEKDDSLNVRWSEK